MLDPRVYRAGFVAVAVAVVVLGFSLRNQQGPLTSSLAPDALNGQNSYSLTARLANDYPNRHPGSAGDDALAGYVAQTFGRYGFAVSTSTSLARTVDGSRTIETVSGTRPGLGGGSIVVVAHRDSLESPAPAALTGTATLLELARVLSGETHHRSIVLVSTSASAGDAGAFQVARSLGGSVDGVIALGDLGARKLRGPVVVPWSESQRVAPPVLRNSVAAALGAQAQIEPGGTSLAGQLVHLAFPLTLSEQGPFGARGVPAVLLSSTGERPPPAGEQVDGDRINTMGRAVLQTINALDDGPGLPTASPYLLYDRKLVPAWAISMLVLGLMLPVLIATVDGLARARRRGHRLLRWVIAALSTALPFALVFGLILTARLIGWISAAPPGPIGAGEVPLGSGPIALLATLALLAVVSFVAVQWMWPRLESRTAPRAGQDVDDSGRGPAVLLVLCAAVLAIWLSNPFAALLLIPALHLWMWLLDPEARLRTPLAATFLVIGLAPALLAVVYYAMTLGLSPAQVLWNGVLLIAGGHLGAVTALEWAVVLGCVISIIAVMRMRAGEWQAQEDAVTIRGPVTYAGPGSLGGTESALRR